MKNKENIKDFIIKELEIIQGIINRSIEEVYYENLYTIGLSTK